MGAFDQLKSVARVLQEAGKIEQYKEILDAQAKLLELQNRIGDLEGENATLKEQLKIKAELTYKNNAY